MKKNIIKIILYIFGILIIIPFILKLDFLFFKVKVCNNSGYDIGVEIYTGDKHILLDYLNGLVQKGYKPSYKSTNFGMLNNGTCSEYKNMNRTNNYIAMNGIIYKDIISGNYIDSFPYKECSVSYIDFYQIRKESLGNHTYNITGIKELDNTYKCKLYVRKIKN